MQMVITRVKLKPGTVDSCADLFRRSNPVLVLNEPDWLGARMAVDRQTETITVMAHWRSADAYSAMSKSSAFQNTMHQFSEFFASPPEVSISEVLVDMTPDSLSSDDARSK